MKYDDLFNARRRRVSNIKNFTFENDLNKQLEIEFEKLLSNNRIQFTIDDGNKGTIGYNKEIEGNKNYYKSFYIPLQFMSTLGSNCLFRINTEHQPICSELLDKNKNKIDPYFFGLVKNKSYRGIVLYFDGPAVERLDKFRGEDDALLLLEFRGSDNSKIHIKRMDIHGHWWYEEKVNYINDDALLIELGKIKRESELNDPVTIILDKKGNYRGVKTVTHDPKGHTAYTKYTHISNT